MGGCRAGEGAGAAGQLLCSEFVLAAAMDSCVVQRRKTREFIDHSEHYGQNFNARNHPVMSRFKWKLNFLNSQQKGSRAVGGKRPHNEAIYSSMEAVSYLVPDTKFEEIHFRQMDPGVRAFRAHFLWLMYGAIGLAVSIMVLVTLALTGWIEKKRAYATKDFLAEDNLGMAWLTWTGSSLALCLVALFAVLYEPAAASSGIPGLIAFLNGVMPRGGKSLLTGKETSFISKQTMFAKWIGMICSIPSGLCVGPEGPIIHICALVGHWTSRLMQYIEHRVWKSYYFTADTHEARDFLATGAACGICVAFKAPLAGVMFVVEEASSFFSGRHLEYTFFSCIVAYWAAKSIYTSGSQEQFTKFKVTTGFFCDSNFADPFDLLLFLITAVVGGLLGAVFNQVVEHLNHLRVHHVNTSAIKRSLEVVFLVLITGSVAVFLPAAFKCEHATRDLMMQDSTGCLSEQDAFQLSNGAVSNARLAELLGQVEASGTALPPELANIKANLAAHKYAPEEQEVLTVGSEDAWKDAIMIDNGNEHIHLHYPHAYTCNATSGDYNPMAMLWLNGGVKGVKVLMQRGFPHLLNVPVLSIFCVVYFVLAALTSGCSVPAGLVVPMLLIGGSFGRLIGVVALNLKSSACDGLDHDLATNAFYWSSTYRWVGKECNLPDPGVYAVVGMAAFLGGSGRITVFLATMMVELTDDSSLIAPVGLVCIISMVIGNRFNHGLYHGLIHTFSMPFLNSEPAEVMYIAPVADIMVGVERIVMLPKIARVAEVQQLVDQRNGVWDASGKPITAPSITHNAFPLVDSMHHQRLAGLVELYQLEDALRDAKKHKKEIEAQNLPEGPDKENALAKADTIHLLEYADRAPVTVYAHTKVARAFELFRKLGMRHLCVINTYVARSSRVHCYFVLTALFSAVDLRCLI